MSYQGDLTRLPCRHLCGDGVSADVTARAARDGVTVSASRHAFPAEAPGAFLRLSFTTVRPEWVDEAAGVLAGAVAQSLPEAGQAATGVSPRSA